MPQVQMSGATLATTAGLLTAVGAETVYDLTAAIEYCINGIHYTKASDADGTTPTTDVDGDAFTALGANEGCYFVWMLGNDPADDAGVDIIQGPIGSLVSGAGADLDFQDDNTLPQMPLIPDTHCPFALQLVKRDSTGAAWTFGTSNWNATGITDLIHDILTMPDKPLDMTTA